MAHMLATFAQFERRLIGQRTRDALAKASDRGVQLGRPGELPPAIVERIRAERADGASLRAIGAGLDRDGVPCAHGGRQWWPATVSAVLAS